MKAVRDSKGHFVKGNVMGRDGSRLHAIQTALAERAEAEKRADAVRHEAEIRLERERAEKEAALVAQVATLTAEVQGLRGQLAAVSSNPFMAGELVRSAMLAERIDAPQEAVDAPDVTVAKAWMR